MKILAKILRGSQNYNLNGEDSDKDYYYIVMPSVQDLMNFKERSGKYIEDGQEYWDVRKFFKGLFTGHFNTLELLFSTEAEFYDKDFYNLYEYLVSSAYYIAFENKDELYRTTAGLAYNCYLNYQKTNDRKQLARAYWATYFLKRLREDDFQLNEESYRGKFSERARRIRFEDVLVDEVEMLRELEIEKELYEKIVIDTDEVDRIKSRCSNWFVSALGSLRFQIKEN